MSKKHLLFIFQGGFYALITWFLFRKFNELYDTIDPSVLAKRPCHILLSVVCFLSFYALLAIHWKQVCSRYTKYPQSNQWLSFFASQPYKYLPSSVFTFSSRAVYAKKLGLPIKQSSVAQLVENGNILLSGFSVGMVFLAYQVSTPFGLLVTAAFLLSLGIISFVPSFKIPKTALTISGREWLKLFVIPFTGWWLAGTAFYFLVIGTGQDINFISAVAVNALAVGLGILAVFAPGGVGVREFVYNRFSINNTGIVAWRLLTLLMDVIVGLTAIYLLHRMPQKNKN